MNQLINQLITEVIVEQSRLHRVCQLFVGYTVFTESAPRPIQSISHDVREQLTPKQRRMESSSWRGSSLNSLIKNCIAIKQVKFCQSLR